MRRFAQLAIVLCLMSMLYGVKAQNSAPQGSKPLHEAKAIQVEPTIVPKPETVKDAYAPNLVQDSLRNVRARHRSR